MNRLKNHLVYLSGPMDRTNASIKWREDITPFLKEKGCIVVNPCDKPVCLLGEVADESPEARLEAELLKQNGNYDAFIARYRPIRNVDLRFCDLASFLIVNFDMAGKPVGTINEIAIAVQQKKPVLIYCADGLRQLPNWIFGCVPKEFLFETWDDLKEYIRHVDEDEYVNAMGRWYLFDWGQTMSEYNNQLPIKPIHFYRERDKYGCFSNFSKHPIKINDKIWPTSEHFYQAQKFVGTIHEEEIRLAKTPMIAAKMGRDSKKPLRQDWEKVKDDIMRLAVLTKFSQHLDIQKELLSTDNAELVEHTVNDSYWGDGGNGQGKNMLGKILMETREKLKNAIFNKN